MVSTLWLALLLLSYGVTAEIPLTNNTWLTVNYRDRPGSATNTHSCGSVRQVPNHLRSPAHMWPRGLDPFYQKYTEAYGIPVLGSVRLSDEALKRACYVARFLLADRPDVRQSYYKSYGRFALMATTEVTTHIPEHRDLHPSYNERARGLGGSLSRPVSTAAEENALCLKQDRYRVEDIVIHEFAHGVHLMGTDSSFDSRLKAQYQAARASGLWQSTYALTDHHEYWAEGVQSYFGVNGFANPPDGIHNHVNNSEKLRAYDPGLYRLIQEVFPCGNKYIDRCLKDRDGELRQELCGGASSCEDKEERCPSWASDGWCQRCSGFMSKNCQKSCGECGTTTTTTQRPQPPTPIGGCADNHYKCRWWAARGECFKNPTWMLVNCKQSCRRC